MNEERPKSKFPKKKKRKSFLAEAKKHGRNGSFGAGSFVSEDTYNYFVRVVEIINMGEFDTEELKDIFVNNTFEQTVGQEVTLASNQFVSIALEKIIPRAQDEPLYKFMTAIATDLRPILCDKYASHVIQTLLNASYEKIQKLMPEESDETDSWLAKYIAWVLKVGRFLLNNIEEFAGDDYANQVVRTVLEVVSGGVVSHNVDRERRVGAQPVPITERKVPKPFKTLLKDYCETLGGLPQLPDMLAFPLNSILLQCLLQAASRAGSKRSEPLCEMLLPIMRSKTENNSEPCGRLMEAMIAASSASMFSKLFDEFYKGKLLEMACSQHKNFIVQKLFNSCPDKEMLQKMFKEIGSAESFEAVLTTSYLGVITAVGQACLRLVSEQGTFIQNLMTALQCSTPPERQIKVVPLILATLNYTQFETANGKREEGVSPPVTLHGSLILQTMLKFNKPIKIVQSLLAMNPDDMKALCFCAKGSRVADAFMSSAFIGEKSREKLVQILKGSWADIACDKYGSRCFNNIWDSSSVKARQAIVLELTQQIPRLKGNKFGRFIVTECGVELFKHQPNDWADHQGKTIRNKRLFADIVGDETDTKEAKKKSKTC